MADWPPKKNEAFTVTFPIYDADGDLVSAAASLDSEVSKDGGTFTDATAEATEVATSSGVYTLALTSGEMNADRVATITKTATAGAKTAVNVMYTVTRQLVDLAYPATSGRSITVESDGVAHADVKEWLGSAPNALVSGRVDGSVGAMAANVLTATAINAGALTAAKLASGVITAAKFASGAVDAAAIATDAITAAKMAADAIGASELAADAANKIADALLVRDMDQVEGSAPAHSMTTAILKAVARIRDNAGTLEIYRTDGSTVHASQTVTTDGALDPIDELTGAV